MEKLLHTTSPADAALAQSVLLDYQLCCRSREISLAIRRDVLTGRAKFGVSDDGKELFQVAMAKTFQKGDFRADYYRGHTLLLALDLATPEQLFAQLYADSDNDPFSAGRQMNNHHATPLIDEQGEWLAHTDRHNLSSDISTTAGQMARGLGLAFASKIYREAKHLNTPGLSRDGNEVCFTNIGDASTSEGIFWEVANAAGVLQVPLAISVLDDGYGISVPKSYQTTKESISEAIRGLEADDTGEGISIYTVKGWDYPALCSVYQESIEKVRQTHRPALIHIEEMTQPQGHSTSGSHERYKSPARLAWEQEYDCNRQFKQWILAQGLATPEELEAIELEAQKYIKAARDRAWHNYYRAIQQKWDELKETYQAILTQTSTPKATALYQELKAMVFPARVEIIRNIRHLLFALRREQMPELAGLRAFVKEVDATMHQRYHTHLYSETPKAALKVPVVPPSYTPDAKKLSGYEVLNAYFDQALAAYPNLYAFGEDLGKIGGVNQGFAGMQDKYGEHRVFDVGIREWSIIGQAIGMAMRGLRPIAEIQYLDYVIYALSALSDDLATLRYRTKGMQAAPVIIRTRGHRLEGIWHSGSPMSLLLGSMRGIYLLTPRNMVQAAGMYNTMLQSDDTAILIECLNGYRLKEALPDNLDTYTVPLGRPEVLTHGTDLTLVTYGSCVRVAEAACKLLAEEGISVELIDVQTLLPFDIDHLIVESLKRTNRLLVLDEDVPGGASAYILQHILELQDGYRYLDSKPVTVCASDHRPPYGSDGDYYSKPNAENVYEAAFQMLQEADPGRFA